MSSVIHDEARAAGTYYVDNQSPGASDANPGTQALPYRTLSAAAAAHNGPGTVILVSPGVYRETVTVPVSGDSISPFVYRALGPGVVVDGSDDFADTSKWAPSAGQAYLAATVSWSPLQVFVDGARLTPAAVAPDSLQPNQFRYVAGSGLYVNVGGGNPGTHTIAVGRRLYGFRVWNVSWVEVEGFTVTGTEDKAVSLSNAVHCAVRSNLVTFSRKYGIHVTGGHSDLIEKNTVSDHQFHGIGLVGGATSTTVQDNECFRNADPAVRVANGLYLSGASGNVIQRNRLHDNQDSGEQLVASSNDNLLIHNFSWNNGDRGFDHLESRNAVLIGCVASGNTTDGFAFDGASTGTQVHDCIAINNGLAAGRFNLWINTMAFAGFQSDYNLFWNSTSQAPVKYGSTSYATIAAFSAASGTDALTLQADPKLVNPSAGDFHLLAGSPVIDAANSGLAAWPVTDAEGLARRDDPSRPNTGAGPLLYADRGAYEFQPPAYAPVAILTLTPDSGSEPLTVTADGSGSSDADGAIVSYRFAFGDGAVTGPQAEPIASHTFFAGTWTVALTVTDDEGLARTTYRVLSVQPNLAPIGFINPPAGNVTIAAGQTVNFGGTGVDPDENLPLSFAWSFGGGAANLAVEDPGLVVFATPGTYTVALTVTDGLGRSDPTPATRMVTVTPAPTGVPADEIHWTFTGPTSVTFDWRGFDDVIRYGLTSGYGSIVNAVTPDPIPFSSPGPFWEAKLPGLAEDTVYHYSIGGGPDHTFRTPPPRGASHFTIFAAGDIGAGTDFVWMAPLQAAIAADHPAFVLMVGDLTYGNTTSQASVDQHFNDVMPWSQDAAYMPVWGNHEWEHPAADDLRNYRGRFDLPHAQTTPGSPARSEEDWSWFDYGNVRFIAYPEPYDDNSWTDWRTRAATLMGEAQADPLVRFIVTFGHRPAYSSGYHGGDAIRGHLDALGATYGKYVLNLNGHSHNYERSFPQYGVTHVTAGTGGAELEMVDGPCVWDGGCPPPAWSAFRAMRHVAFRLRFYPHGIQGEAICGPPAPNADLSCAEGTIVDSFVIGTIDHAPAVTAPATAAVDEGGALTVTVGVTEPDGHAIDSLLADPLPAGAVFTAAPGNASGVLSWSPTHVQAGVYGVTFTASGSLSGSATTAITIRNVDRAPVVTAPPAVAAVERTPITFGVSVSDPDGEPIASLVPSGLPPGAVFIAGSAHSGGIIEWTPAIGQEGVYALTFTAANALPGSATTTLSVRASGAPVLTAPATASAFAGSLLTLQVSASDPDHEPILRLTASDLPSGAAFVAGPKNASGTMTWTPTAEQAGPCSVTFAAENSLTGFAATRITVRVPDRPPVVTAPAAAAVQAGRALTLDVAASDPDGDAIASLTATALPAATFAAGGGNAAATLAWTPAASDVGSHTVTFAASNALSGAASTVITVLAANQPPIVALGVSAATGNEPLTVTADATGSSDSDGSVASFAFDFGDGTILGPQPGATATHTYAAGNWSLAVTVTDNQGGSTIRTTPVLVGWAPGDKANLVGNPSFESDDGSWGPYASATLLRVPGGFDGDWALRVTGPATVSGFGCNDSPNWVTSIPGVGTRYRCTAWVRCEGGGGTARLQVREYAGATRVGIALSHGVALMPAWQILTMEYVSTGSGTSLDLQALDAPLGPGEAFIVDNISIYDVTGVDPLDAGPDTGARIPLVATVAPSPLRTASLLSFVTSRPGPLRVALFDLGGRCVRSVLDEANAPAGLHVATVDGKDDRGRRLGSGLYFYRIHALEGVASGRIVIAR